MKEQLYNYYGLTAIDAVKLFKKSMCCKDSWIKAIHEITISKSAQEKGCPKNTFLGLCEEGLVKGIPKGNYTESIKNKDYALEAIKILKASPNKSFTPKELWSKLKLGDKRHNSQMDVILGLWNEGLII